MLTFNRFEGMVPRLDPAMLADGLAEKAINVGFKQGALAAAGIDFSEISLSDLKATITNEAAFNAAEGLFYSHMADAWFVWTQGTEVKQGVDSLIAPQDEWNRIYFADQNGPRYMTSDQYTVNAVNVDRTSYRLGIPFPEATPAATKISEDLPSDVDTDDVVRQQVAYVFTLVDDYGHEGPPSNPSNTVLVPIEYDFQVDVTVLEIAGTDVTGRAFTSASKKRIYRTAEGTESADFFYVGEIDYVDESFSDTIPYGSEGELIPTLDWFEPPAEIKEITAVASNYMAGYYDNMVCYSVPKLPHAWPLNSRFPLKYTIVGIMSTANGLFIGTTGKPYWAFGADPEAALPVEVNNDYPCINADSIVDVGGFIVYASHDGLVAIDGQDATLITESLFSRIDWQSIGPESIKAFAYEGRYFFYSAVENQLYSMRPDDDRTMTLLTWSGDLSLFDTMLTFERALRYDRTVLTFPSTEAIQLLEVVSEYTADTEWLSRKQMSFPMTFNFIRVRGTAFPVTVTVYSEGNDDVTVTLENERPVRLPRFKTKSRLWSVNVAFNGDDASVVRDVILAKSTSEFPNAP